MLAGALASCPKRYLLRLGLAVTRMVPSGHGTTTNGMERMSQNVLLGKKIEAVWLASDKRALRFDVDGGEPVVVRADGDCCSSTWIESLDMPGVLPGATVLAVEEIAMPDLGSPDEYDVLAYYGCKITTDKGACVIDYRNESNGYYGGELCWPGEGFYGGVYGQNESTEDWQIIAGGSEA